MLALAIEHVLRLWLRIGGDFAPPIFPPLQRHLAAELPKRRANPGTGVASHDRPPII
jgi:hypothetical protein